MRRNSLISNFIFFLFPIIFLVVYGGVAFDWNFALYMDSIQDLFARIGRNAFATLGFFFDILGEWGSRLAWIVSPFVIAGLVYRTKRLADEGRRGSASWASILAFGSLALIISQIDYAFYPLVIATIIASSLGLMWRGQHALVLGLGLSILNAALLVGGVILTVQA